MQEDDPCPQCDGEGWIDDPLSSACGGRWFRYCDCPLGEAASEEDRAEGVIESAGIAVQAKKPKVEP